MLKNYASSHVSKCLIKCNLLHIKCMIYDKKQFFIITYDNKKYPITLGIWAFFFLKDIPKNTIKHTLKAQILHKRLLWQPPFPQSTGLGKKKVPEVFLAGKLCLFQPCLIYVGASIWKLGWKQHSPEGTKGWIILVTRLLNALKKKDKTKRTIFLHNPYYWFFSPLTMSHPAY